MRLFGFDIIRKQEDDQLASFSEPVNTDGALTIGTALGGSYGYILDIEGDAKTEAELVTKYRSMMYNPEIDAAVNEIVNESIVIDSNNKIVKIVMDDTSASDKLKKKIEEEFENVLKLLDFSNKGYEIFSRYYVDGRLNYHVIVDENNIKDGIKELRYVDPRKLKLVREVSQEMRNSNTFDSFLKKIKNEYYIYSDTGFNTHNNGTQGTLQSNFRISKDSIVRVTSGLVNESNTLVLSYLHKAIKSTNQLRMLEDANVVYTLTRAPERRVFYIDVGNLPKAKAEQYLHDMMARHKNKVSYDSVTGEIKDGRKMMTLTEDYWFPRREGNRSTEIDTLPSAGSLNDNDSLTYFQNKLYRSLNVPLARLQPETMFSVGRASEISREEIKFAKFIKRIRAQFSILFDECLERQLVFKGIVSPEDWVDLKNDIRYEFNKDNFFEELKETEIMREKVNMLRDVIEYEGRYFSKKWIIKNVLYMTESEYKEMKKEIEIEKANGEYDTGFEDQEGQQEPSNQESPPEMEAEEGLNIIDKKGNQK